MVLILLYAFLFIHKGSTLPVNTGHYPDNVDGPFFEGSVLESNEIPFDDGTEDVGQSYSTVNEQNDIDYGDLSGDASSVGNKQANEENSDWEGYYKDASSENGNTSVEDVGQSSWEVSNEATSKERLSESNNGDGSIKSNDIFGFEDVEASKSKVNTEEESSEYSARGGKMLRPLKDVMYSAAQLARFGIITASNSDAEWSYKGTTGFEYWGSFNYNCLGNSQSPINIDSELVKRRSTDGNRITFTNYERVNKQTTRLENNGHSVELKVTSSTTDFMPTLSGGHLKFDFHMIQLHFHWAKNNYAGSEHTINRRRFPLEMHLVHITPEDTGLAVAGFVFRIVAEDNPAIEGIIEMIEEITHSHTETDIRDSSFNVQRLIAPSIDGPYYTYDGSLTTPGCDEIVDWILFRQALLISSRQIEKFRTILDSNGDAIENNFRPIQPLNSRIIYKWED